MSRCDAELCENWTGQGCICEVMDLPRQRQCGCGHGAPYHDDELTECDFGCDCGGNESGDDR